MKNKRIIKHAPSDSAMPDLQPSKSYIPEWYKKTERFSDGINNIKKMPAEHTLKLCPAFSDALISGYMIPLATDIAIEQTEAGPSITWSDNTIVPISLRDNTPNKFLPIPVGHSGLHFSWLLQHYIKLPKGYSAIFTHPLNRFDLPFTTLSGIVDGDFAMYKGNLPVFFSSSFEGIIPQGTPIVQIIPFKTENWKNEKNNSIIDEAKINELKSGRKVFGWYKQTFWQKKVYE